MMMKQENGNVVIYKNNIESIQQEIDKMIPYYAELKHFSIIEFNALPKYVQLAITEKIDELKEKLKKLHLEMAKYQEYLTRY